MSMITSKNKLYSALESINTPLDNLMVTVTYDDSHLPQSCSADLELSKYGGRITHWPEHLFEFQFHDLHSGDVVFLDTMEFKDQECVSLFIMELLTERLK